MLRRKKKHVSLMESGRNGGKSQTRQPGTSGRSPEGIELQDVAAAKETKLLEPLETKTAVHPEKKEAAVVPLETYEGNHISIYMCPSSNKRPAPPPPSMDVVAYREVGVLLIFLAKFALLNLFNSFAEFVRLLKITSKFELQSPCWH